MKSIIVCASALVLGFCGCSDNNGGSAGGVPATGVATAPRAVDGALVSAGADKAAYDKLLGDKKGEFYKELTENLDSKFKMALSKAGLDDIEIKWGSISVVDVKFEESGEPKDEIPEIVFALAFDHDFDKIVAALKEELNSGSPQTKDATFLGEKGFVMFDDKQTVAIASVGGKIFVGGTSEAAAEKAVALYRDGKGGKGIAMDGAAFKACANAIGERVIKKMPAEMFEGALGPDVDAPAVFQGLKDASASITPADGGVAIAIKLETAKADDASKLVSFLNQQLEGFKAMMTMMAAQDPDSKPLVEALNAMTIKADGAAVSAALTLSGETFKKVTEQAID